MNKNVNYALCGAMCLLMMAPVDSMAMLDGNGRQKKSKTEVAARKGVRTIASVETITVDAPVGTVPRLPYQVLVTYSDGTKAYRQARWSNAGRETEKEQADAQKNSVGKEYQIAGVILGDNSTPEGYPIVANVKVVDGKYVTPSNKPVATPLPLESVTITGDNRLTSNRDLAIETILSWDVTQQLYNYRDSYGLPTEGYTRSAGWDSPTTKLKGHGSGHYMSALAFAYASATKPEHKEALLNNIRRMVTELRECQERTFVWNEELGRYWEARDFAPEAELIDMKGTWDAFDKHKTEYAKYGYGYINAIPAHHAVLIEKYAPYNNEAGVWAPYYSIHKQLAGLIDIANIVDDKEIADKAYLIAKDMGLWIWNRMHYRTYVKRDGSRDELRAKPGNRYEMWNMYIAGEVGGTGESLARLAEMTSDSTEKARLLEASNCFDSPAFYDPLSINVDDIRTRHANQHIPMIVSALRSYLTNNNPYYYNLALNFWNLAQGRYIYSTGGVGNGEMFREPYTQILSMNTNSHRDRSGSVSPNPNLNETCCVYNLLKLTKDLNTFDPDNAQYMDYYERALYNQMVGSLHPHNYATTYHYAVGLDASKQWGNNTPHSTCCGGTGSENHVKYQEAAYFTNDNTIWVGLYIPSVANWEAKGVKISQNCLWPAEKSTITVEGSGNFTMKVRVPYWATEGFSVKVNGEAVASEYAPCSYVAINRSWKSGDVVEVVMPFTKHINYGPDKMERAVTSYDPNAAFAPMWVGTLMYGPLAMSTAGIENWDDATISIDSYMDNVVANGATAETGTEGNLYTLTLGNMTFQPDYSLHEHSTRYCRINVVSDPDTEKRAVLLEKVGESKIFPAENYTTASYGALSAAVAAAEALYQADQVSEKQIKKAVAAVDKAIAGLTATELNKTALEKAIEATTRTRERMYTWDSYAALQAAVAHAKDVVANSKKQTEIDIERVALNNAVSNLVSMWDINKSKLVEALQIVKQRQTEQEAWNAMAVKVPVHAPWAPYAYARLIEQAAKAQDIMENKGKNYNQAEVDAAAADLNGVINTMRPGNLPELEDLNDLTPLLNKARELSSSKTTELNKAIEYAEMVVSYVTDGSGTMDMIVKACDQLKALVK